MRFTDVFVAALVLILPSAVLSNEYYRQRDQSLGNYNGYDGGYYDNGWNNGISDPHYVRKDNGNGYQNQQYDRYGNLIYQENRLWRPNNQGPQWGGGFPLPYQESPKRNELYYDNLGSRKHDRSLLENLNNYPVKKN
ncbi:hypothetical protein RI129_007728 [Pyrocoelia pectoralis]|uniref:Uncharacterized protein n=1 Tax=Pyrocoelia pectoralis TaxID=417401 RepID=A0AAN7ZLQ0_9COLE